MGRQQGPREGGFHLPGTLWSPGKIELAFSDEKLAELESATDNTQCNVSHRWRSRVRRSR